MITGYRVLQKQRLEIQYLYTPKGHNYGADLQDKFKLGNTMLTVGANYENENTKTATI